MNAVPARRVVIVPGLAVRRYALPAARRLAGRGVEVDLRPAPGAPGQPADLEQLLEAVLPAELLRLPAELERVDALLDDAAFFEPFVEFFDPRMGRPSTPRRPTCG